MALINYNIQNLEELRQLLSGLPEDIFQRKVEKITESSIGQHLRHIIEFYQTIFKKKRDMISYDDRERDKNLEENIEAAITEIDNLIAQLKTIKSDSKLIVRANYGTVINEILYLESTLFRELAYAMDHTVHHLAIVKIIITNCETDLKIDDKIGVASSTLRFRKECAQ